QEEFQRYRALVQLASEARRLGGQLSPEQQFQLWQLHSRALREVASMAPGSGSTPGVTLGQSNSLYGPGSAGGPGTQYGPVTRSIGADPFRDSPERDWIRRHAPEVHPHDHGPEPHGWPRAVPYGGTQYPPGWIPPNSMPPANRLPGR